MRIGLRAIVALSLIMLSNSFFVTGQKIFSRGYVVTISNDTIRGFISSKSLRDGSPICYFKTQHDTPIKQFLPFEIGGYGTDSLRYESRRVKNESQSGYYRLIFKGKLFLFKGAKGKFLVGTDTARNIYMINKGVLYYLTNDQPELKHQIDVLKISEEQLIDLFSKYHHILGIFDYRIFLPARNNPVIDFYVTSGYNISGLTLLQSQSVSPIKFSPSYAPSLAFRFDYFARERGRRSLSFNSQLLLTKELFQYTHKEEGPSSFLVEDILFESFVVKIPIGVKFQFLRKEKFQCYATPGFFWQGNIVIKSRRQIDTGYETQITTVSNDIPIYSKSLASFCAAIGVENKIRSHKVFFEFYYDNAFNSSYKKQTFGLNMGFKIGSHEFQD